ncbi:MAG TPA: MBG domain-containing protein, partial [Vicinamibacterales bacterium]|nr:MBG domain-containing protein [Vicinamibacterales bacterium]
IAVGKATPVVTWATPSPITYGTALGASELAAEANVAGTFTYSPAAGTVLSAGTHQLTATFSPADASNYTAVTASVDIAVGKAVPVITWASPAGITYGTALSGTQLNAATNVNGSFVYSPAAGTVLSAGTQTLSVTFTPDDAANYNTATANVSIAVAKASPVITWAEPAGITYGAALSGTQLNATANVSGSFAYSPAAGTVLGAGAHSLSVTFTPADAANYTSASAGTSIEVAPAPLTVQADNSNKVYGEALPAFAATGSGFVNGDSMSSLSGTLTFTTSAIATSAPGSYGVTPGGVSSPNYAITFADGTLTVSRAATALTLTTTPNPSQNNQAVQLRAVVSAVAPGAGTATGTVQFYENGTLLGSATLVNGVATMNKNFKKGSHSLTATYGGNANFTGSTGAVMHDVP